MGISQTRPDPTEPPQDEAEPISQASSTSGKTYLRKGKIRKERLWKSANQQRQHQEAVLQVPEQISVLPREVPHRSRWTCPEGPAGHVEVRPEHIFCLKDFSLWGACAKVEEKREKE